MTQHIDILDEQESLRTPLVGSLAAHLGIVALAFAYMAFDGGSHVERWGDPKSLGGGAVGITPVRAHPFAIPTRAHQSRSKRYRITSAVGSGQASA